MVLSSTTLVRHLSPLLSSGVNNLIPTLTFGRFMARQPKEFRRGESGHCDDAGDPREIGDSLHQRGALCDGATVVPQDGWADRLAGTVDEDGAVHLTRESERAHVPERVRVSGPQFGDGQIERAPPIVGTLF